MIVITQGRHTEFKEEFKGRNIDCEVLQNYTVSHTDYLSRISGCPLTQATETSYVVSDLFVSKEISYRGLTGTL